MRYLVTVPDYAPFFTNNFEAANHWQDGMVVYDLKEERYTTDGEYWMAIEFDIL